MSVFCLAPREDWICDRIASEWNQFSELSTKNMEEASIVWLLADWCWRHIDTSILRKKYVICTTHHIVPEKFDQRKYQEFLERDAFVHEYHVPCFKTKKQLEHVTKKPIHVLPFWVNQHIWFDKHHQRDALVDQYKLPKQKFLIGSFQRDTEGADLITPKLEKGPDLFCDAVNQIKESGVDVHVVLAGWRRQYVISRLKDLQVDYSYFELPSFNVLNDLYNCLNLYIVASRYEGGPQAIVECAANKTPIVSTDVGLAPEILPKYSIFTPGFVLDVKTDVDYAYNNVCNLMLKDGIKNFEKLFLEILNKSKT
jgi:glycosyltransferase involved in cell wall biosynthesis